MMLNLHFAWIWILLGLVSGTFLGIRFHDEQWLGGYSSWRRRVVRLGHISFLGTGLLNVAFFASVKLLADTSAPAAASLLLIVGAVAMPAVCFLSAWRDSFRRLFFIPVAGLILGTIDVIRWGWLQ